jgi:hypothetical protein
MPIIINPNGEAEITPEIADSGVKAEHADAHKSLDLEKDRAEDVTTKVAGSVEDDANAEGEKRENAAGVAGEEAEDTGEGEAVEIPWLEGRVSKPYGGKANGAPSA